MPVWQLKTSVNLLINRNRELGYFPIADHQDLNILSKSDRSVRVL